MYTEGEAHIVPPMAVKRAVFYAHKKEDLLTDYFHLKIVALPNTTMPSSVDFLKSAKNVLKELVLRSANRVFR
jgi:thiazole synthase ThiGH ThiG subunit